MTRRDREFLAALCAERAGLKLEAGNPHSTERALSSLARRAGFVSVAELVRSARDRGDERLADAIVEALAPARTAFFRDPQVFRAVADVVSAAPAGASMRIWSIGCAGGQEAYSLAMMLEERSVRAKVQIVASDVSERLVEKAQAGLFSRFEVQDGLSAYRLVRHFENCGDAFSVTAPLRRMVRCSRANLLDAPTGLVGFDIVMCRYVLGAMVRSARLRALGHLVGALSSGGRLVLSPEDVIAADALGLEPDTDVSGVYRLAVPAAAVAA